MKEYTITRCDGTPNWNCIPELKIDSPLDTPPLPISAFAQVCYDNQALHVHLRAVEEHVRAELTGKLDEICEDSCLEFFFCPMPGDKRYFNIECNPNGCMYLGFASNVETLIRLIPETPPIHPQVVRTNDGWELYYTVPFSFIRNFFPEFAPVSGYTTRANFYKCGDKTPTPHYYCWNPVPMQNCAFHNPDAFGIVRFA